MPKIKYQDINFARGTIDMIDQANRIITEYQKQGFILTLRQLYYQFVSRDLVPNSMKSYKRLGGIVNDGRLAGMIDWNAIEDRTRSLHSLSHWEDPADIMKSAAAGFRIDKWATQKTRVEVWVEKEALAGVFQGVCDRLDIPLFCCRGYTSQSEMWVAARRLAVHRRNGQTPLILHFGDHDPSGIDMSRDIVDRIRLFSGSILVFDRLALNMDQIEEYGPPPNPAKSDDSRFEGYVAKFGDESWELDALEPKVLANIVEERIDAVLDRDAWDEAMEQESNHKANLELASEKWDDVTEYLNR